MPKLRPAFAITALLVTFGVVAPTFAPVDATASVRSTPKSRRKVRSVLRRKGLAKLPSVSGALGGRSRMHHGHMAAEVSGTPPVLVSIPDQSIKDLFWQPGVVDAIIGGTATQQQCGEFWAGQADGTSGGLGACRMAENVGYSFGDILSGESSLCYMKRFPTRENLAAGAVSLVSGEFPGGDVSRLFSVPEGSTSRLVKVAVSGEPEGAQDVFLRVYSDAENQAAANVYAVDLWFCHGGLQPDGLNTIRITSAGEFTVEEQRDHADGSHVSTVTGVLSFDGGRIVYDTTRSRRAQVASAGASYGAFKADHEITADNTITSKTYGNYSGGSSKSYIVMSFSGTGPESLRFLAGAFKERNNGGGAPPDTDMIGSTEYRDPFYAASPGSALESLLDAVDLGSDPFYASPPSLSIDTSAFSCGATPDIAVALDFANPAAAAVRTVCENGHTSERMRFCESDPTVEAAQMALPGTCFGPH